MTQDAVFQSYVENGGSNIVPMSQVGIARMHAEHVSAAKHGCLTLVSFAARFDLPDDHLRPKTADATSITEDHLDFLCVLRGIQELENPCLQAQSRLNF